MPIYPTSYRSIGNLTDWLIRFSIVLIILSIIDVAATSYLDLLGSSNDTKSNNIYSAIGSFTSIISILVLIIILFWYYRATKNIHSFGVEEATSPIMAVMWWFVPIANLWKPYYIAQQIWKASRPEVKLPIGTEWKKMPNSNIIKKWWVLALVSIFGSLVAGFVGGVGISQIYDVDPEQIEDSPSGTLFINLVTIPFLLISIVSIIFFIRMIRQISNWQYLKSI
ncbi:MAG TPA: DUF4328 domain-containing protein [Nitrososphaeraceae archaeon]|jgi:hypothetical protein